MKKLLLLALLLFPMVAFADRISTRPTYVPILQQLQWFYTALCEDVWGGTYTYDQTPAGPSSWRCEGGTRPERVKPK